MRSLSRWAHDNVWYARITIVFSYILLNAIGFFIGRAILTWDVIIPVILMYSLSFLFLFLLAFYPLKKNRSRYKNYYTTQKTFDLFLVVMSFILVICYSNKSGFTYRPLSFSTALAIEPASVQKTQKANSLIQKKKSLNKKELRQHLKNLYSKIKQEYKTSSDGEKAVLITLSVIIALILMYLVAAISCNLSCSGADGAAVVVLLLGFGAIIYFLIKIIKRISRGKPEPKTETTGNTSA